jgi:hypothetical protein
MLRSRRCRGQCARKPSSRRRRARHVDALPGCTARAFRCGRRSSCSYGLPAASIQASWKTASVACVGNSPRTRLWKAGIRGPPLVVHLDDPAAPRQPGIRRVCRAPPPGSRSSDSMRQAGEVRGVERRDRDVVWPGTARLRVKSSYTGPCGTVGLHSFTSRTSPADRIPSIASHTSFEIPIASSSDDKNALAVEALRVDALRLTRSPARSCWARASTWWSSGRPA